MLFDQTTYPGFFLGLKFVFNILTLKTWHLKTFPSTQLYITFFSVNFNKILDKNLTSFEKIKA